MFTGNTINSTPTPLIPNQQVVIPQITIPQGFQTGPSSSIIVKGKEMALKYKLPPNFRGALFDEEQPLFYYRETDANGNDVCFKTCSYAEVEEPPEPEYLTVQEFRASMAEFANKLKEDLSNGQFVRSKNADKYEPNARKQHNTIPEEK